jgi:hypothetical protein
MGTKPIGPNLSVDITYRRPKPKTYRLDKTYKLDETYWLDKTYKLDKKYKLDETYRQTKPIGHKSDTP